MSARGFNASGTATDYQYIILKIYEGVGHVKAKATLGDRDMPVEAIAHSVVEGKRSKRPVDIGYAY
jgi:hypothetical protein